MSAEKCGRLYGFVLVPPKVVDKDSIVRFNNPEYNDLVLTKKETILLRRIRQKEPGYSPFSRKEVWGKAYKMGLLDDLGEE